SFCDVYSMGKVFDRMNRQGYRESNTVIALMTAPDPALRITDLEVLETMFAATGEGQDGIAGGGGMDQQPAEGTMSTGEAQEEKERSVQALITRVEGQQRIAQALSAQLADCERTIRDLNTRLQGWEAHWQQIQETISWTAVQKLQQLRKQIVPTNSVREKLWL